MRNLLRSSFYFPFQIFIDDRERKALEDEFRKLGNMIIHRRRLGVGDYLFDSSFLVERKTIPDFCISVKDGRLFRQARELAKSRIFTCIILEGKNRDFKTTGFSQKAIQGILLSLSLVFRLPVLRTKNTLETVQVMLQSYKQLSGDEFLDQQFYTRPAFVKKKRDPFLAQKIHILQGFPGIGTDKAKRLLIKFESLWAVFAAAEEELLNVPGIGKETIKSFVKILKK